MKIIPRFPTYTADDQGNVYGSRGLKKPAKTPKGYMVVRLYNGEKGSTVLAHRHVWEAFNGVIPQGMQINHINGIRDDNRIENLQCVEPHENMRHYYEVLGTRVPIGSKHPNSKLTEEIVRQCRRAYSSGVTQASLAKTYGVSPIVMSRVVTGKAWKHVV